MNVTMSFEMLATTSGG